MNAAACAFRLPTTTSGGILIVDDEPIARTILGLYFHQQGNPFWLAPDRATALRILESHGDAIGLVLLHSNASTQDTADTLAQFREFKPEIAYYLMTAECGFDAEPQDAGADGLIVKPLLFQALNLIVEKCFAHA